MAQAGYTPIQLYFSTTASAAPSAGNLANGELALNITDGKLFYKDNGGVVQVLATKAGASGDVVGPGSSTDNALVRFDSTTGKLVQNSVGILDDSGNLTGIAALTTSGALTLNGGTANGVAYLNGSKVLTTGSALTFDGTTLTNTRNTTDGSAATLTLNNSGATASYATLNLNAGSVNYQQFADAAGNAIGAAGVMFRTTTNHPLVWGVNNSEQMRLTSTGLGIGTSSPGQKLHVVGNIRTTNSLLESTGTSVNFGTITGGYLAFLSGSGAEAGRFDSSGNLGLGVTPSAWVGSWKALQVGASGALASRTDIFATILGQNWFINAAGNDAYIGTGTATAYRQREGQHQWLIAPSGTAGNAISFTQAMTLDASGDLLVGTTSTANTLGGLVVRQNGNGAEISATSTTGAVRIRGTASTGAALIDFYPVSSDPNSSPYYSGRIFYDFSSNFMSFATNGTERARITSSGNFLVGATSTSPANDAFMAYSPGSGTGAFDGVMLMSHSTSNNTGSGYVNFYVNTTVAGSINQNGTNAVAYNTSSDYRLKEDIQPMTGALAKVSALKPCTYKWKSDGSGGEGFIAHELAEVCPHAVTGEKDGLDSEGNPRYQGIDTSFLVATLTAAIQELKAEFDAYKAAHP